MASLELEEEGIQRRSVVCPERPATESARIRLVCADTSLSAKNPLVLLCLMATLPRGAFGEGRELLIQTLVLALASYLMISQLPGLRAFRADAQGVAVGWNWQFRAAWEDLRLMCTQSGEWVLQNLKGQEWRVPQSGASELMTLLLSRLQPDQIVASGALSTRSGGPICRREQLRSPGYLEATAGWIIATMLVSLLVGGVLLRSNLGPQLRWSMLTVFLVGSLSRATLPFRRHWRGEVELDDVGISARVVGQERRICWEQVTLFSHTVPQGACSVVIADGCGAIQLDFRCESKPGLLEQIQRGVARSRRTDQIVALPQSERGQKA